MVLTCKYANKYCPNERALKRDGTLHTLCEVHRQRTNSTQRQYWDKRAKHARMERRQRALERQLEPPTCILDMLLYDDDDESFEPIRDPTEYRAWSNSECIMLGTLLL
ncbi:Aste57867_5935 [Aphanomyces stellatus]|uniref:Aste57867_332 protein n=1 Tax=Aphanomyces stellatus TaxID=120398 RepID=A0A485K2J3_9STRA|nr:hypothetical protein As57867_005921 [Aphanomyces stellatus]KAF0720402.1 hypothetical protein As57867_000332 [Aphanomyces stellatus]VFT77558.1 Aste57867_332 [Aphanomyces stellatus]VFT82956.1 Aste57867_5935 [Aphanomyces stellatus]